MKLDIIIVDLALVAAVFLPYFLFILIGQREERKLIHKFSEEAERNNLNIDEKDNWNNNIVGLDKSKAAMLLIQKRKAGIFTELINIREVMSCEIVKEVQTVRIEGRSEEILQRLELQLKLRNGRVQMINLYNCDETYSQDYELQHAERWKKAVNSLVAYRPTLNSAA